MGELREKQNSVVFDVVEAAGEGLVEISIEDVVEVVGNVIGNVAEAVID